MQSIGHITENLIEKRDSVVKVTNCCSLETIIVDSGTPVKFEIDTQKIPGHKALLGKAIGDRFYKGDIFKLVKDKEVCYEIINITPRLSEKEISKIRRNEKVCELIRVLDSYGFEGFIHTTEIENFKKILNSGYLYPRNELKNNNVVFKDDAEQCVLEKTPDYVKNCCRFYYYYKTPTNYSATKEGKYKDPIIMVFDKSLAYEDNVFFCPTNAQQGMLEYCATKALNFDWEGIFERGGHSCSKYCPNELTDEISKKITLVRNAEFLVKGKVSVNHINKIYVSSQRQYDLLKSFCSNEIMSKVVKESDKFDKIF